MVPLTLLATTLTLASDLPPKHIACGTLSTCDGVAGARVRFLNKIEAAARLEERDEFFRALTAVDRSVRAGRIVTSDGMFADFITKEARSWNTEEIGRVRTLLCELDRTLAEKGLRLTLPPEVEIIKTTGREEGYAAYTREHAVVLPKNVLNGSKAELKRTLAHELFHLFSRELRKSEPGRRNLLYRILAFEPIGFRPVLPSSVPADIITNPDAFELAYSIVVRYETWDVTAVPVFVNVENSRIHQQAPWRVGEFRLLTVARRDNDWVQLNDNGKPLLLDVRATNYLEKIGVPPVQSLDLRGHNLHPEEILATAFEALVAGPSFVLVPKAIRGVEEVLRGN